MAKVSILMNGYNSEKYLEEAIDSVYAQSFEDWEIIFIDNCSTDNTKAIIEKYDNKIKYYSTDVTIPLGEARNFGLEKCHGEYLAFLDTDDVWLTEKLQKQIVLMNKKKDLQMCYAGVIYIDEDSKEIGKFIPNSISGDVFMQQLKRYEINMQSVLIRNNIKINFEETMQFSPDFDLFMKIASKYQVGVIKDYLVKYRKLKNSLTSQKMDRWWIEMKQTLDKIFTDTPQLKEKYKNGYNLAYAKVSYNKARYLMSIDNTKEARAELSKYKYTDYKYLILYMISLFGKNFWNFVHRYK